MTSPHLPAAATVLLAALLDDMPRAELRVAQVAMSAIYRDGGHSRMAVPNATAALAYAVARMPATYAACARAFDLAATRMPAFAPVDGLDIGAGAGAATLAATAVWPQMTAARLIEPNAALAALAIGLIGSASAVAVSLGAHEVAAMPADGVATDLVMLSYMLAEQAESEVAAIVAAAAARARQMIIVVEPGTPAGYARVLAARQAMIAAGLHILAPCPHAQPCPLSSGDWCHFSVRLQRTAAHMQLKDASVPFEDERFSFVAAVRNPVPVPTVARLIRPPVIEKGFADLALCTTDGLETRRIRRRDGAAYKSAKGLVWGDEV